MSQTQKEVRWLRKGRAVIWLVTTFVVVVFSLELLLLALARGVDPLPGFFAPNSDGTYQLAAGTTTRYWHSGRIVTVTVTDDGQRTVPGAPEAAPVTLHIIGDSQVFGWGLNDEETVPARVQAFLGSYVRVVNHGLPGLGPLAYLKIVAQLPSEDPVIVFLTEMNDFQDAYDVKPSLTHHCGFIVLPEGPGKSLPCFLLRSYLVGSVMDVWSRFFPGRIPLPLGFNPYARISARVICRRIENNLIDFLNRRTGESVVSTIPWEAQVDADRLAAYAPGLAVVEPHTRLPGTSGLLERLKRVATDKRTFLLNDHHLSAEGADVVARYIVEARHWRLGARVLRQTKGRTYEASQCEDVQ